MIHLRDLLLYIISVYSRIKGRGIGRTKLMKLVFLIDYHAIKELGSKITKITWFKWLYGPFSRAVLDTLDVLEDEGIVEIEEIPDIGRFYKYSKRIVLPEKYKQIVDRVLNMYMETPLDRLLDKVYNLPEVKEKKIGDIIL